MQYKRVTTKQQCKNHENDVNLVIALQIKFYICRNSPIKGIAIDQKAMLWLSPYSEWFQDSNNIGTDVPDSE
jgi:hypothetical protein